MRDYQPTAEQIAWERTCSPHVTTDIIWNLKAYRSSLFILHCVQLDLDRLRASADLKDQLIRAAGAIGADIAEGYSRSTRADRVRYYGYALGSIRECLVWYLGLQGRMAPELLDSRLSVLSNARALTLGLIRSSRTANPPTPGRFEH